ncbi:unnamed protein product [Diabrotica balteata]|uniref:ATP synthase-coupling factor 6, mitochondrial n=1 Tax=Diabrotica balteata TaxID=107213 RepID=A0A9N9XCL3_DIABA|nr:unnamed protein product [Diabrotica balteata]
MAFRVFLPNNLNGENYLYFLQYMLPEYLDEANLAVRKNMLFVHDGASAHYHNERREYLFDQYPGRWSGGSHDVLSATQSGKSLVEPTPELEKELKTELDKVAKQYGGGQGVDMTKFPSFKFQDPVIDPINLEK